MKSYFYLFAALACMLPWQSADAVSSGRILIDDNWLFSLGDTAGWQSVSLPHDWSVRFDFDQNEPSGNDGGYLPTGKGFYRKTLSITPEMAGKPCHLYFEGAYMDSEVFINGQKAGGHPYGYTSFRVDAAPLLRPGDNTIEVIVDNSRQKNSRWYTGSGLYRHVWLEPHPDIYIEPWTMQVTTPAVSSQAAIARINFAIANPGKEAATVKVDVSVEGALSMVTDSVAILPGEAVKYCSYEIAIDKPRLWSPASPALYTAKASITLPGGQSDTETERFGFRTLSFTPDRGFELNGEPMLITGACVHHDNGILGAASYDDAELRKVRLLKDAGFNAVRTSHNPPAPAFLDACDSLGLLVIDEAFDGWKASKNEYDYSTLIDQWWDSDISAMVRRDRNHPSVIAWSIGNEIIERKSPEAVEMAQKFGDLCRALDGTRPVTQAFAAWDPDWEIYDPLASRHEVMGYNYMIHKAEGDHQRVPSRVMWQTESYPRDAFQNWEKVTDLPYVIGDFVWTGIDYIGESGIGRYWYEGDPEGEHYERPLWPWHNSYCGDIDIIGHRKPISYYRQMLYSPSPMLHLSVREPQGYRGRIKEGLWAVYPAEESWLWPGHEGKPIEVEVASTYPMVELYQDGTLAGRCATNRSNQFKAVFTVDYAPGQLTAVAYDADGNKAAEQTLATPGKPYALRLSADKERLGRASQSMAYVTVEVVDKQGNIVPNAVVPVTFQAEGADIIATGSGNPKDPDGYSRTTRLTDGGRALAIVKSRGTRARIKAKGRGLRSATLDL